MVKIHSCLSSRSIATSAGVVSLTLLTVGWGMPPRAVAQGPFAELVRRVPDTANALVLLNVQKVHDSPLAIREGWKEKQEKAFENGMILVPPQATHFLSAAQIDFEVLEPLWQLALMDLTVEPSMRKIAQYRGGREDQVAGTAAVALPNDAYAVQFGPRTIGLFAPGNRQNVARWVEQSKAAQRPKLSPYLTEALGYADQVGTEIIMALDVENVLPPPYVREKLTGLECLANLRVDLDQVADVLASLRGVTLGIVISDKAFGKLKVDFQKDASPIASFAKPLLLEVLANNGCMVDDFQYWTAKASANQISIEGTLSGTAMRQVLSVVDAPQTDLPPAESKDEKEPTDQKGPSDQTDKALYASQQYFRSINRLLGDLRTKRDVKTIAQYGTWFNNYGRKIDRLPMLHVDPQMLDYGAFVSSQLRDAAMAIKGIGMNTRTRQVNAPLASGYGSYRMGGLTTSWVNPSHESQRERSRIHAEERVAGAKSAREIMQDVENETAKIRRAMSEKYKAEF